MMPVDIGFDPATSLNAPCPAAKDGGATSAAAGPGSFHHMLRDATAARDEAPAKSAPVHGADSVSGTDHEATAAARAEVPSKTAPAHIADAVRGTGGTGRKAAVDDSAARATSGNEAVDTAGQPVWELLAQIIQNLTAGADTNAVAVDAQDDAVASDPKEGDAAEELSALVDLLKQLQESAVTLTVESAIPLNRLRQILEQWQAGANEGQTAGPTGRLLQLLKSIQAALPGIAWDEGAAAMASQDGAAEKVPLKSAETAGAEPMAPDESQPEGRPIDAGRVAHAVLHDAKDTAGAAGQADASRTARGVLHDAKDTAGAEGQADAIRAAREVMRDAKDTKVTAGQPDAAVRVDERGPGEGRVMPAPSLAASPATESLRSTALPSKAQASEGSFVLPRNFEPASDTQSEASDDFRPPAEKALAGLTLPAADQAPEEGASPSLRFDAALRDVHSFAVPEGSPDKPADAAAAAKGRDAAAAPVKTDVFDQIVQRAAVHVKNDQGEIRIDLKPEFLGQVRLQIVTDNQQITVRILTELPMVRDMIESNIHQLKSDLQQQGLQVERVEVAVADDPRQNPGRQARTGSGWKGRADEDVAPAAAEISAGLQPEAAYRWGLGGQATINMFA
jgi:flagellar hook-length control protein FliK